MIRNRILLKSFAVFFLLEILLNTLAPAVSWALTAGPTAPETTSFEPVDTTDMVNLLTGDLAYNIPLLEVPGPAGGYPLSLSYHAGIQPNEDASWVGLGWTLNPGAINRSVNGYADDYENTIGADRMFWEGGETSTFTIGVSVGYGLMASASAGLTFSNDTYMGYGVGHFFGVGLMKYLGGGINTGFSYNQGVGSYGDSYSSTGLSIGIGKSMGSGFMAAANLGVSFNKEGQATGTISAGVQYLNQNKGITQGSVLDASMSTGNSSVSVSAAGLTAGVSNSKSGNVSTSGYDYNVNIPIPTVNTSIILGASYHRYWIDETQDVAINGSLYFPTALPDDLDNKAYDVYDLMDSSQPMSTSVPDESVAGSFIDYDSYQVLGQGVSGMMRPYHYKSYLLRQNKKTGTDYRVKDYPLKANANSSFRFVDDFSNRYLHEISKDAFAVDETNSDAPLSFTFDANRTTGENGSDGFVEDNSYLAGSKHIEWYTNAQISDKDRSHPGVAISNNFIDCTAQGFHRDYWGADNNVGGFKIVNESGVTYHYALPVYSYGEDQYSGQTDDKGKISFNRYSKFAPYAYTWLLTTVTGPDYVDVNLNGFADDGDYGYWVNFEYGNWTQYYNWRNPSEGFNKDVDRVFDNFSLGIKEVYYLNAIRTQTHTALFIKGKSRYDAKSTTPPLDGASVVVDGDHNVSSIDPGGFDPDNTFPNNPLYPVSSLQLESIYLMNNSDLKDIIDPITTIAGYSSTTGFNDIRHGEDNIISRLDMNDAIQTRLHDKCLKLIVLNTDYSLCPGTANSYISPRDAALQNYPGGNLVPSMDRLGKLTLNAIRILGKGSVSLIPETKFNYSYDRGFGGSIQIAKEIDLAGDPVAFSCNVTTTSASIEALGIIKGDIVRYTKNNFDYYAYVEDIDASTGLLSLSPFIGNWGTLSDASFDVFIKTKNPPYDKDFYDIWGMYKVDYKKPAAAPDPDADATVGSAVQSAINALATLPEDIARRVTETSGASVDAWSLHEITNPMGSKLAIDYESDQYRNVLKSLSNIPIKNMESLGNGQSKITLYEDAGDVGLVQGTQQINLRALTAMRFDFTSLAWNGGNSNSQNYFSCPGRSKQSYIYEWFYHKNDNQNFKLDILSVDGNTLVINYDPRDRYPNRNSGDGFLRDCSTGNCYGECSPTQQTNGSYCIPFFNFIFSDVIFLGGEIFSDKPTSFFGGGIRVKRVSIVQNDQSRSTMYEYTDGVTPYEPLGFAVPITKIENLYSCLEDLQQTYITNYRDDYQNDVYSKFQDLFSNSRELPGPGVMYGQVRVREEINRNGVITTIPGYSEYEFEVFSPDDINLENGLTPGSMKLIRSNPSPVTNTVLGLPTASISTTSRSVLEDFSPFMGNLKRVTLFDKDGNKVNETVNNYLQDDGKAAYLEGLEDRKSQGQITETFADARLILQASVNPNSVKTYTLNGLISQKIRYPSIQIGQTSTNYKTGIKTSTSILAFDFYSGLPIKNMSTDGFGNSFVTETLPAYKVYSSMGLAFTGGKNMLSQEAASYAYKSDGSSNNNPVALISASVQTWSNSSPMLNTSGIGELPNPSQYNIWRKENSYAWKGDDKDDKDLLQGLYPYGDFQPFNFSGTNSPQWQKNSGITLYDVYSHPLEAFDLNENYAATKMSLDNVKVLSTANNTRYEEFAFSGAEDNNAGSNNFGGGVSTEGNIVALASTQTHTGLKVVSADVKVKAFTYSFDPTKNIYHISFWSTGSQGIIKYKLDGGTEQTIAANKVGTVQQQWSLWEGDIDLTSTDYNAVQVWCETGQGIAYFDDFRVHPLNSNMISYVYNGWGELSHILNGNNLYTKFCYDASGRLIEVYQETLSKGIVKSQAYEYEYFLDQNN